MSMNPLLNEKTFAPEKWGGVEQNILSQLGSKLANPNTMSVSGVVNKTIFLFGLCLLGATGSWLLVEKGIVHPGLLAIIGALGGMVCSIALIFKATLAKWLGGPFAILEGLFLGALSIMLNAKYPGIVTNAVVITFGVFIGALIAYRAGWVRMGKTARAIMTMGLIGIGLSYLASMLLPMIGFNGIKAIHQGGTIGLVFSAIAIVIAVMSLIDSIQMVDEGVQNQAPKDYEWVGAFGLLSSLVFLYIEILRLLAKLQSRN
jgi:uncharacterized YccA/Bax inhibitor family protein